MKMESLFHQSWLPAAYGHGLGWSAGADDSCQKSRASATVRRGTALSNSNQSKEVKKMAKCVCGSSSHKSVICPQCKGKGRKGGGAFSSSYECSHCKGTGQKCPKGK